VNLLHDKRPELVGQPGVHALIIGVSEYPFLAGGANAVADPWDMGQLTSTASTAHKVFDWLKTARLPVPLATCRVLLSPSPTEPHLAGIGDPATFDNVFAAAHEWRTDASSHRGNITFFYFAGHGVARSKEDAVLCLHNFREPPPAAPALRRAIDVATLTAGMSPSPAQPEIARTQFYFIDACRVKPDQLSKFTQPQTTALWDPTSEGQDDRSAPVLYASVSNALAGAIPGVQTLFSRALIACLTGEAGDSLGEDAAGNPKWGVTIQSLTEALGEKIDEINVDLGGDQNYTIGGLNKPATICLLDQPPSVDVVLSVDPPAACEVSKLVITGNDGQPRVFDPPFLHPVQEKFQAGLYSVSMTFNPPAPPFADRTRFKEARAPRSDWKVSVV